MIFIPASQELVINTSIRLEQTHSISLKINLQSQIQLILWKLVHELPKYVDRVCVVTLFASEWAEIDVVDWHVRFRVYCVKPEALNVVAVSLISVWITQVSLETSTATHVGISKHSFRQSDSDVFGYSFPFGDAISSCLLHVSHPEEKVKHHHDHNHDHDHRYHRHHHLLKFYLHYVAV